MTNPVERRRVETLPAAEPEVGRWVWALRTSHARTEALVRQVADAEIDLVPHGLSNSIGALLYHVAIVEAEYLSIDMLGGETFLPELQAILPWPVNDTAGTLSAAAGESAATHLDRLRTIREAVISHVGQMDLARFHEPRDLPQFNVVVSPAWIVAHLIQHEAEHRGEIGTVLGVMRRAGG